EFRRVAEADRSSEGFAGCAVPGVDSSGWSFRGGCTEQHARSSGTNLSSFPEVARCSAHLCRGEESGALRVDQTEVSRTCCCSVSNAGSARHHWQSSENRCAQDRRRFLCARLG